MSRTIAYTVLCKDKPGPEATALREQHLHAHFEHIEGVIDRLFVGGPLMDGDKVTGSLLLVKAENAEEALALAQQDPYYAAGVWETMEVSSFVAAAGDWVGGKTW